MSKIQRFFSVTVAVILIACAALLYFMGDDGFQIIALILSIYLFVCGIRVLIYFFTMAVHMVGGRLTLFEGVIIIDIAVFTLCVSSLSEVYIAVYLAVLLGFTGVMDILSAFESKGAGNRFWLGKFLIGLLILLNAIACIVFIRSHDVLIYIFIAALVYSAVRRIIAATRKMAVVYVQ